MSTKTLLLIAVAFAAQTAWADTFAIAVTNPSFETTPVGGFPNVYCGGLCDSSTGSVPGWVGTGQFGEWIPGPTNGAYTYLNSVPDGNDVAWINSGTISQTTAATVVAGATYTLQVDLALRKDVGDPGDIYLVIGSNLYQATGTFPTAGNWSVYSVTFTGTQATAGQSIGIELYSASVEGVFDNVQLSEVTAPVPEPASLALMLAIGLAVFPVLRRLARA